MRRRRKILITLADAEGVLTEEVGFQEAWPWIMEQRRHGFALLEIRVPNGPAFVPGPALKAGQELDQA